METLELVSASIGFFAVSAVLLAYELSRIKAGRPILNGGVAAQSYYIVYLSMFCLSLVTALKAILG
jgi:hypothetical protein